MDHHKATFKFPTYFKNLSTGEFYQYSDGNKMLQFNSGYIHLHCAPYLFNTRDEFISFLNMFSERYDILLIDKDEFNESLKKSLERILTTGMEKTDYMTKEAIKLNNELINKRT